MVMPKPNLEFDRPVSLEQIERRKTDWHEVANADECVAIAKRLKISAVDKLTVTASCSLYDKDRYVRVLGQAEASVKLTCGLSLEDFTLAVIEPFDVRLAVAGAVSPARDIIPHEELDVDEAAGLFPDFTDGQYVNLGEIAVEALSLAIPEFPRAPDAALPPGVIDEETGQKLAEKEDTHRPFAKLAILKDHKRNAD
jgi:uncharacterized metal-binding protein YceD (DUF177 family)